MTRMHTGELLDLSLVLGGVRAGKSDKALSIARSADTSRGVLFVATAQALDEEMRLRIAAHQRQRPSSWETLESPVEIAADIDRCLASSGDEFGVVVIDCMTLWVSNILLTLPDDADAEAILAERAAALIGVCMRHRMVVRPGGGVPRRWVVVSNEVGLGIVPPTSLGRRYRDALGRVNQLMAAAARDVSLMVAGIELVLKSR
jgi:adenosylcobinamide kinase / adenosylcobinamide-phosphate guanylyltransferase